MKNLKKNNVKNLTKEIKKLSGKGIVWLCRIMKLETKFQYRDMPLSYARKLQKFKNKLARIDQELFFACERRYEYET